MDRGHSAFYYLWLFSLVMSLVLPSVVLAVPVSLQIPLGLSLILYLMPIPPFPSLPLDSLSLSRGVVYFTESDHFHHMCLLVVPGIFPHTSNQSLFFLSEEATLGTIAKGKTLRLDWVLAFPFPCLILWARCTCLTWTEFSSQLSASSSCWAASSSWRHFLLLGPWHSGWQQESMVSYHLGPLANSDRKWLEQKSFLASSQSEGLRVGRCSL